MRGRLAVQATLGCVLTLTACQQGPALLVEVSAGPGVRADPGTLELIIRRGTEEVTSKTLAMNGAVLPQSVSLTSAGKTTGLLRVTVRAKAGPLVLAVGSAEGELAAVRPLRTLAVVLQCASAAGACECAPLDCAQAGASCGTVNDRCGGLLQCGACPAGQSCGAGGPARCGQGTCAAQSCGTVSRECGLLDDGCGAPIDCGACPATSGRICVAGRCACAAAAARDCGSSCVSASGCCASSECSGGKRCEAGLCTCPTGDRECAGNCVPAGSCCVDADCTGGRTCQAGACACPASRRDCLGTCIPAAGCCTNADCSGGRECQAGACGCPLGKRTCAATCIPTGDCCSSTECSGGKTCQAGTCRCAAGQKDCAGACIPTLNCCGDGDCASPKTCQAGACTCPTGYSNCGGICVSVGFDKLNCGACGNVCPNSRDCVAGQCLCVDPTDDVDKHCCPANMSFLRSQSPTNLAFCYAGPFAATSITAAEADCKTRIGVSCAGMGKWGTSTLYAAVPQTACGYWWDGRSQGNGWVGVYQGPASAGGGVCSAACTTNCTSSSCNPIVGSFGCTQPYYCVRDPAGPRGQYCADNAECPPGSLCIGLAAKFCTPLATAPTPCCEDLDCTPPQTCKTRGANAVTGVCN